jgi:hypothetical protein
MQITVQVPKAFSVRDENEFYAFQHLLGRMNPQLRIAPVTTGVHVNGGCTVLWGLAYADGQRLAREDLLAALEEAGFDLKRNSSLDKSLDKLTLASVMGPTEERLTKRERTMPATPEGVAGTSCTGGETEQLPKTYSAG